MQGRRCINMGNSAELFCRICRTAEGPWLDSVRSRTDSPPVPAVGRQQPDRVTVSDKIRQSARNWPQCTARLGVEVEPSVSHSAQTVKSFHKTICMAVQTLSMCTPV